MRGSARSLISSSGSRSLLRDAPVPNGGVCVPVVIRTSGSSVGFGVRVRGIATRLEVGIRDLLLVGRAAPAQRGDGRFSASFGLFSAIATARVGPAPICSFIAAIRRSASSLCGSIWRISLHTAIAWTRKPFCA